MQFRKEYKVDRKNFTMDVRLIARNEREAISGVR